MHGMTSKHVSTTMVRMEVAMQNGPCEHNEKLIAKRISVNLLQ